MRRVLFASCLAMLAVGANGTAIMAALPTMQHDIGLGPTALEWAVNAYLVASACGIVPGGKLAGAFGAGRISVLGLSLFSAGSVIIATAWLPPLLLAGRAAQGLGAALAVPATLAAVDRAAIGAWTGFLMLGFSIGPLFGGWLTHSFGWRFIFWMVSLVVIVTAFLLALPGASQPGAGTSRASPRRFAADFDWAGFFLLALFMTALNLALGALRHIGRNPLSFAVPLVVAAAALGSLYRAERATSNPLLDLGFFARPRFTQGIAVGAISMFSILSFLLYFNLEAQDPARLDFSALDSGLALLPLAAGLLGFSLAAPAIVARFGLRTALTAAMLLIVLASGTVAFAVARHALIPLSLGFLALGAGLALPYATGPRLALSALAPADAGLGSGIINAGTFLGGAVGVAGGGVAFAFGGFSAVMALTALAGLAGTWLCRFISPPGTPGVSAARSHGRG